MQIAVSEWTAPCQVDKARNKNYAEDSITCRILCVIILLKLRWIPPVSYSQAFSGTCHCYKSQYDTIPNHSTFSKIRTRKWQQSSLFQKAFYEIVKQCIDSGLIDGEAMAADGSYIPANVSRESWINVETEVEQSMQSYLDSLDGELSNQPGFKKPPTKIVKSCWLIYRALYN